MSGSVRSAQRLARLRTASRWRARHARALSVAAVLLTGLAIASGCTTATPESPDNSTRVLTDVAALLEARAGAALTADRAAWDSTIAPDGGSRDALSDEFDVFSAIPWQVLTYEQPQVEDVPTAATRGSSPTLDVSVTVVSQIRGAESGLHRARETFTVTETPDGWRLLGHPTRPDLARPWLAPGTRVARGQASIVVGTADQATLDRYAADADNAVATVASAWTGLEVPLPLVVVPATAAEVDAFRPTTGPGLTPGTDPRPDTNPGSGIGVDSTRGEVAAFTDGPMGADGRATGDRIVVDPAGMGRLTPAGRAFVLTHETVHVALRARLPGQAAIWLQEGYADWVGYDKSGLASQVIAAAAVDRVRRDGVPVELPSATSFARAGADLTIEYQLSWLLVDGLVADHGSAKVQQLIEAATVRGTEQDAEAAADRALADVLGTSRPEVLQRWQARLAELVELAELAGQS